MHGRRISVNTAQMHARVCPLSVCDQLDWQSTSEKEHKHDLRCLGACGENWCLVSTLPSFIRSFCVTAAGALAGEAVQG